MLRSQNRLLLSFGGALVSVLFVIAPVLLIRRNLHHNHIWEHWQEVALYVLCIAGGGASGAAGFNLSAGTTEITRQRAVVWGSAIFFFLYIACSALCAKIHFGDLKAEWWRTAGLVVLVFGGAIRLWAIVCLGRFHSGLVAIQTDHKLIRSGPYKWIRHPSYLGALIALAGIPLIFGSWFPLLALPGAFVALRWRMNDEEGLLASEFGEEFQIYKRETWRMIPPLY